MKARAVGIVEVPAAGAGDDRVDEPRDRRRPDERRYRGDVRRSRVEVVERVDVVPRRAQREPGHRTMLPLLACALVGLAACGGGNGEAAPAPSRRTSTTVEPASTTTADASSSTTSTTTTAPPPSTVSAMTTTTTARRPASAGAPASVPFGAGEPVSAAQLPASWHPGCPVGPDQLRLLTLPYIGFDGTEHQGRLVVHAAVATGVSQVFARLHAARFPIAQMVPVDLYGGDDDASTRANNTSAFNCRAITGGGNWSEHAYGRAIDINPVQNPYVYRDGHVLDPAAAPFVDRNRSDGGLIHAHDVVVQAFAQIGWGWGGNFNSIKDYQHFSASGR
jgi:hypothetical protein